MQKQNELNAAPTEIIEGLEDLAADISALQDLMLLLSQTNPAQVTVIHPEVVH